MSNCMAVVTGLSLEYAPSVMGGEYAAANIGTLGTQGNANGLFSVYNFQVADYHTYFAAPEADKPFVWVHNANYGKKEVALGLDPAFKNIAEKTGSTTWRNWGRTGLSRRRVDKHFGRAFNQAAKRAEKIHFALDGIDDVEGAIKAGGKGFTPGNFTNAELATITRNPELLAKTTFYRRGVAVDLHLGQ